MCEVGWRTSSHSSKTDCVEVAWTSGDVQVRDTKDRSGGTLAFGARRWRVFLRSIKTDVFAEAGPSRCHRRERRPRHAADPDAA